jgi:TP901-1 family phage major tail protein
MARGVNFLIYINTGTAETPVYTKVAGQRGGTLNREYETIDVTSKDNFGWSDEEYGVASWSIEADGLLVEDDAGYAALETAFEGAEYVMVRFETQAGNKYEGSAIISDFSIEAPFDDTATYSLTLNGKGAYTKTAV